MQGCGWRHRQRANAGLGQTRAPKARPPGWCVHGGPRLGWRQGRGAIRGTVTQAAHPARRLIPATRPRARFAMQSTPTSTAPLPAAASSSTRVCPGTRDRSGPPWPPRPLPCPASRPPPAAEPEEEVLQPRTNKRGSCTGLKVWGKWRGREKARAQLLPGLPTPWQVSSPLVPRRGGRRSVTPQPSGEVEQLALPGAQRALTAAAVRRVGGARGTGFGAARTAGRRGGAGGRGCGDGGGWSSLGSRGVRGGIQ